MSVLQLLGSAADGGAETYFVELAAALRRAGVETECAIRHHSGREVALAKAGVLTRPMGFGGPLDPITAFRVAAFARERRAKVLTAWMNRAASHTPAGPWARIGRLGGYYKLKYYRGFDALVGNTADIAAWMVREGWPAEKAHYIPNFARLPSPSARPESREALDTPRDAPLLLGLGRLHTAKAHDVSIRALALMPDAYLWIAGAGPLERELKALAAHMEVTPRVRFLRWRADPTPLYLAADVCVFPSRFEPLGNVVIQSWAHGLPVVAAASQGPGALIRDGVDGLLTPVDAPTAVAQAARRVLSEPALRLSMIAAGRARIEDEFDEAKVVAQWRALYARYGEPG